MNMASTNAGDVSVTDRRSSRCFACLQIYMTSFDRTHPFLNVAMDYSGNPNAQKLSLWEKATTFSLFCPSTVMTQKDCQIKRVWQAYPQQNRICMYMCFQPFVEQSLQINNSHKWLQIITAVMTEQHAQGPFDQTTCMQMAFQVVSWMYAWMYCK